MSHFKKNKIVSVFCSVTGVILLSKLLGFVKQMITASVFGATIATDLINLSEGFIGNVKYVLVSTLTTSFVAIYLHIKEEEPKNIKRFAVDVGKAFSIIAAGIVAVIILFAPQVARIIAPSYSETLIAQLATYLRLFSPALLFFIWTAVFHALLNANKRFIAGELEGFNQSIILILLVLTLQTVLGVQVLAVAFLAYVVWNAVFLGIVSRPYWQYETGNPFQNPAVRRLLQMAVPLLLGYAMVYINQQVDKILVSGLTAGTVTAMGYAAVLSNLVGTVITSFASILFAYVTSHISKGEQEQAAALTLRSALLLVIVFLPISILTILCAPDIVAIVYGRGAFGAESVQIAAAALAGYAIMFVPLVLRELFSRFQYGYQSSKTPMINSSIGIGANIALSILLCPYWGVFGVTFATSISVMICGLLNMITSRKCNTYLRFSLLLRYCPVLLLASVGCGVAAAWALNHLPFDTAFLRFGAATLCGGVVYLVLVAPILWRVLRKRTI